jgi:beta-glucosidase-like glycosyl hydrolase
VNEIVNERLLMELYGPPFAAAVANASGVMWCARARRCGGAPWALQRLAHLPPRPPPRSAYNLVNGVYACENPFTLRTMLKGRYGFTGYVVCASAAARVRS